MTGIELDGAEGDQAPSGPSTDASSARSSLTRAGIWAPRVAAMAGVRVPSTPVDHQHVALKAVPGSELPRDMPCFRDTGQTSSTGSPRPAGIVFGGYEPDPVARWIDGAPWEHGGRSLPPDMIGSSSSCAGPPGGSRSSRAEIVKLVCHPDAMTPDANPSSALSPTVRGLWFAAGLSLNGFGAAGGLGRPGRMDHGRTDPSVDLTAYRPWRFGRAHDDAGWVAELARETYRYYYLLRYPFDQDEWPRPKRRVAATRSAPGRGCRLPGEARMGAAGALRAGEALAAGRARISEPSVGRDHPGSTAWATSIVPSASAPVCSISVRSGRSR